MVTIVRHGRVNLPYPSHAEMPFEVLADLASGKLNPGIDAAYTAGLVNRLVDAGSFGGPVRVLCSPSRRATETAELVAASLGRRVGFELSPTVALELREVEFDLRQLYPNGAGMGDISSLNVTVLTAVLAGRAESVDSIRRRVERLMEIIASIEGDALLVSHDFIMRFIELLVRRSGNLGTVTIGDLLATQRNGYLEGFSIDGMKSAPVSVRWG